MLSWMQHKLMRHLKTGSTAKAARALRAQVAEDKGVRLPAQGCACIACAEIIQENAASKVPKAVIQD